MDEKLFYQYQKWIKKNEPTLNELELQKRKKFNYSPLISIIVPVWNTNEKFLIEMLDSVRNQTYENWELCIADGNSEKKSIKQILDYYSKIDKRIKIKYLKENKGIVGNSNEALALANGDFIALLDHDDIIPSFALFEVVKYLNEDKNVDFIYSDEDKLSKDSSFRFDPHFKPDWSPDTLRSCNYITHFSIIKKTLLDKAGWFKEGFDGSQDYDLILRCTENAKKIIHIPKILYHWRVSDNSTALAPEKKLYAYDSGKKALEEHLDRIGLKGKVKFGAFLGSYKIDYDLLKDYKVSIIILNLHNKEYLERCIYSIQKNLTYSNYEILIIDYKKFKFYEKILKDTNISLLELNLKDNYKLSKVYNIAVQKANGEIILFLENDTNVISTNLLQEMLMFIQRSDVGIVGAKLYYPNDKIQHAGIIVGKPHNKNLGFKFFHKYFDREFLGYFGKLTLTQNFSAVTGACLMTKKEVFKEMNGFDENYYYNFFDIDYCLKVRESGYLIVWTPFAELYHYELILNKNLNNDLSYFLNKWKKTLNKFDPYYNPNLI